MRDAELVHALRAGDEAAFARLVDEWSPAMTRAALGYVRTRDVAEEVVQEAWLGVLKGLDRFEGRSSLKTWVFRILVNTAQTRGQRERRSIPMSNVGPEAAEGPAVDPDRFLPADHDRWPGHWAHAPLPWPEPAEALARGEARDAILAAIAELPERQREVITLRDVAGFDSAEVCNALDLSEVNQRVLLHRARSKVRGALEALYNAVEG